MAYLFIDMIFTCDPTLLIKRGLHSHFYSSYHHQALYTYTLHLKICNLPLHAREAWNFDRVETDTRKAAYEFTWDRTFVNLNAD